MTSISLIIGIIGTVSQLSSSSSQIIKILKRKSTDDISALSNFINAFNATMWISYNTIEIFNGNSTTYFNLIAPSISFMYQFTVICLKIKYDKEPFYCKWFK